MSIQQKTSVTNYTTEFQQVATFLGDWSEQVLMEHYYQGLKEEIDNRLFERRTEQQ
ncbi:hypothetical protein VTN00DRAFT_6696 [Thermoascus crustaceus]|uniref:uncharacterized protein n=1 Tax=Thermoascus crustaceus TaxID=5088 RepID=UPI0037449774